ncbi:MAG TPA: hypothetical protein VHM64_16810 [Candidatus Binatia bacterium]|nr:hypothetical protein [Candidatus Binatia bacterium]
MALDARETFANLTEKEKLKGHHSPEGQAIRTFTRALSGWTAENLSVLDVLGICEQATEDWLKARLNVRPWSSRGLSQSSVVARKSRARRGPTDSPPSIRLAPG